MIVEALFTLLKFFITLVANLFSALPSIPTGIIDALDTFLTFVFDNMQAIGFFIPMDIGLPLLLLAVGIDNFILRKIPFLNLN